MKPLFDNNFVARGNLGDKRLVFFPGWCKNGITQIQHITYGVIPKLLPNEAIKEMLADKEKRALQHHKHILQSIPKDWEDLLNTEVGKPDETFYLKLDGKPKLVTTLDCKALYNVLLQDKRNSVDHSYRQKWANTLGPVDWDKIFKNLHKSNFDGKANDPRWKIIHRCITTARRLAGRSPFFNTSTCKVCEKYEENLKPLFYLCSSAKKIWNYVNTVIRQRFPSYKNYHISVKDILCDFPDHDDLRNNPVTGLLRDTGLRHIWQHRNRVVYDDQKRDTLSVFKAKLKQKVKTKFLIAKTAGKIGRFRKNWAHHNLLTEINNNILTLRF